MGQSAWQRLADARYSTAGGEPGSQRRNPFGKSGAPAIFMRAVEKQLSAHRKDCCHRVLRKLCQVGDSDGMLRLDIHPSVKRDHDVPKAVRMALKQVLMALGRPYAEHP